MTPRLASSAEPRRSWSATESSIYHMSYLFFSTPIIVNSRRAPSPVHCNENSIYVFLFRELRGLSPNFHIHVSVSDLYIPRIGPHISCSRIGRSIVGICKSLTDTWMWKLRLWPRNSFSGNICFEFLVLVLCSVCHMMKAVWWGRSWGRSVTVNMWEYTLL